VDISGTAQGKAGSLGLGTLSPNSRLEIATTPNGNGIDGIVMGQLNGDDSNTIQTYINNQWSNRTTYAGGCCNMLYINPDVGQVTIGNTAAGNVVNLRGTVQANGSAICTANGTNCPAAATGKIFGGMYTTTQYGCYQANAVTAQCNCPTNTWAQGPESDITDGNATHHKLYMCTN
jgi:hypothetical protein